MTWKIGIDLGGTKTESILLDHDGKESFRKRLPTPAKEGYGAIIKNIAELVSATAEQIPETDASYTLGMGIPGIIDSRTGLVMNANTTSLIGHPLKKDMEELISHPIQIENDANCFTMAECRSGAAAGYSTVFGIIMGTGCGGGLYMNGSIHEGAHGIAGEWGHVSIDPNGMECWCSNRGCIETMISGSGMERSFSMKYGYEKTMAEITEGWRSKDPDCLQAFEAFLDNFGRALGGLISIFDPDAVVIGGGLSNIEELYTEGKKRVEKAAFHKSISTPILKNSLGDSAGVFGAAWIGI